MNEFIAKWCDERHKKIGEEFKEVWSKINKFENRLWAIIVLIVISIGVQLFK